MNCNLLAEATKWACAPAGRNAILAHAPITLGKDGQHISFYVMEDSPGHFYLTDAHSTIQHAMDHGAKPTVARLQKIANAPGALYAKLTQDGEVTAEADSTTLNFALWDALRLAMAISDNEIAWVPKPGRRDLHSSCKTLRAKLPTGSVVAKPRLQGVSGHQIDFPGHLAAWRNWH